MPALSPYFAQVTVERVATALPAAVASAAGRIAQLLDSNGLVAVDKLHAELFALATPASANASLSRVFNEFNRGAEKLGHPVRMHITAAKSVGAAKRRVWFEGPAPAPTVLSTPELRGIPAGQLVSGQRGVPLGNFVVLVTVNDRETRAVLERFCKGTTPEGAVVDGMTYNFLGQAGDVSVIHVVCEMGSGTLGGAQACTAAAIAAWSPRAVIAVGVAFGADAAKQKIGDVLVSKQIQDCDLDRINANGTVTPRGSKSDASPVLLHRVRTLDHSLSPADRVARNWPKLRIGTLLSSAKLIDNLDHRNSLIGLYGGEAIGGEMEGSGLYVAAQTKKVDWIVIKGICDWADGHKGHDKAQRQDLAAANAATVVWEMLQGSGLYADRPSEGSQGTLPQPRATPERGIRPAPPTRHMGLGDVENLGCLEEATLGAPATLRKDGAEQPGPDKQTGVETMDYLQSWLRDPNAPRIFALLGEYGMGKTVTCQRLARLLEEQRQKDPALPMPLYFDLRHVTGIREGVPTLKATVEACVRLGWNLPDEPFEFTDFNLLVDEGALVILDGLDEVLVKLSEADGQVYTNHLLKLLADADQRRARPGATCAGSPPRLLVSCRTQFFRTLRDQNSHFTGQERGDHPADAFRALLLLPFTEDQVLHYLTSVLPGADPEQLMDMIRSVHNLEELTRRPYTLKLVSEFVPEIEADRAAGRVVRGVTLYRRMVGRWLDRDKGKHHIKSEHKLHLAAHLAAEMARSGREVFPISELESWFHQWLDGQPDLRSRYARLHPDQLEEDLRTATFLVRVDAAKEAESGFRFAHTSLREFFLASYLLDAVRHDRPEAWAMGNPGEETLDFLGQMLDEAGSDAAGLLTTMQGWRRQYRAKTSELLLMYALRARERSWQVPILHGIDLRGAQLRGLEVSRPANGAAALNLGPACLVGADLRQARFEWTLLAGADLSRARLDQAEFHDCELRGARFVEACADGAVFRRCTLGESDWARAQTWRTRFVFGRPDKLPAGSVCAPLAAGLAPRSARLRFLSGHDDWVMSCAFSPDGARLVSGGDDGRVRLWDAVSGEVLRVLSGHQALVWSCEFSPDGSRLVSAGHDGTVRVWDAASGAGLRVLSGHQGGVRSCAFSPDGARLASAGDDGSVRLWDAASGVALRVLSGHQKLVASCAFSPDGARLVSAGDEGSVRLWDTATGEVLWVLSGHPGSVMSCAFSPDGARLLSAGSDGTVRLRNAASGEVLRVLSGHEGLVMSCAFSRDGTLLVSASSDGTVRLWDAASGEVLQVLSGHNDWVRSCAFSPDGARLASAGDDGTVRLWDTASGEVLRVLSGQQRGVRSCASSPDGARLLSGGSDGTVRLWDAGSGEALRILSGHRGGVRSCAFSPGGSWLASAGDDRTVRLWDAATGEVLRVLSGHQGRVWSCAFSPDGARLVSAGSDASVHLWDTASGDVLRVLSGHEGSVLSCAFSPDGARLLTADVEGTVRLWDAASGKVLRVLSGHEGAVMCCAFSPDSARLVSAGEDDTVRLWDAASGEALLVLSGHQGGGSSCAFSPDGARLVSAGYDGTVRLWDAVSGEALLVLPGNRSVAWSCAFSPDGARLLSAGRDGTMRLWDADTGACLRIAGAFGNDHAVWEPSPPRLIEATDGAWRWLHWQVWEEGDGWMPIPLESFGPLPTPKRMAGLLPQPG